MKKPTLIALDSRDESSAETMLEFYRQTEIDVFARTLWGEARGEGHIGMVAVACVVLNRVERAEITGKYWWGSNIVQICQKPYQFSCWNRSDPNFQKLQNVDESDLHFATALRVARRAIMGALRDVTNDATHYHAQGIKPFWAVDQKPSARIGNHIFYNLEGR